GLLAGTELGAEVLHAVVGPIEAVGDVVDLPAVQAEAPDRIQEARLEARAAHGELAVGTAALAATARPGPRLEVDALERDAPDARELREEAADVALVVLGRVALVLRLVAHQVPQAPPSP